jgi:hypothetical protein
MHIADYIPIGFLPIGFLLACTILAAAKGLPRRNS